MVRGNTNIRWHASRLDEARGKVLGVARELPTRRKAMEKIKGDGSATQSVRETTHDLTAHERRRRNLGDRAQRGGERFTRSRQYGTIDA